MRIRCGAPASPGGRVVGLAHHVVEEPDFDRGQGPLDTTVMTQLTSTEPRFTDFRQPTLQLVIFSTNKLSGIRMPLVGTTLPVSRPLFVSLFLKQYVDGSLVSHMSDTRTSIFKAIPHRVGAEQAPLHRPDFRTDFLCIGKDENASRPLTDFEHRLSMFPFEEWKPKHDQQPHRRDQPLHRRAH